MESWKVAATVPILLLAFLGAFHFFVMMEPSGDLVLTAVLGMTCLCGLAFQVAGKNQE